MSSFRQRQIIVICVIRTSAGLRGGGTRCSSRATRSQQVSLDKILPVVLINLIGVYIIINVHYIHHGFCFIQD